MPNYQITFDEPWLLLLLIALPLIWVYSFSSLSGLGPYRRLFAIGLRSLVLTALVLALAGIQLERISDRMTVLYLLDQSESIPKRTREAMLEYVTRDVQAHRRTGDLQNPVEDKAGIIIFGREATIEYPPFADELRVSGALESLFELRTDATNIAAALKLAQASFPEDSAKRIVIVTDGNENLGDARGVARSLADNGIGIDVVPIKLSARSEVAVEKISLPPDIRRGQPLEARVVVENFTLPSKENPTGEVSGRLRVQRTFGGVTEGLGEKDLEVTLKPGKNVFSFQHTIDVPAGYSYSAEFFPDDAAFDLQQQNNKATAFTHVRGKGRVLLIEDWEARGEFAFLIQRLGEMNIEVEVMPSDRLFTSLAELQGYDCVVMANVPRASGGETDNKEATNFTDDQISMLVRNTEQFGCGLVMLGGPNSFGAGGWANTELEKAMPVDFQIKNEKVKAVGALVMMMHASELAQGNYWQKVIGQEALKVLGPSDYCGCVHWDDFTGKDNWLWKDGSGKGLVRIGGQQKSMLGRLDRMTPGDMPQFEPAMTMALKDLKTNQAAVKHMIIISDGDPSPPSGTLLTQYRTAGVKITTVAVGTHGPAGSTPLQNIANATGGKYYVASNPKALPRIFQIEARRVARPLVFEDPAGFAPGVIDPSHEMLQNITTLPPIKGYVLTTVKENPLVEVLARSPKPGAGPENSTLLASWTYGAGRSAVFTSDAGQRWANDWTQWENYDKFYSQMIRWAMRPVNEEGKFSIATDVKDGKVRVVVTALDKDDEFLNFLNMSGVGTGPEMENVQLSLKQEAPGRYVGEFSADKAGSYLLAISPGAGKMPLLTGVNVPYSAEFRERETNRALLESLATFKPSGGDKGTVFASDLEPSQVNSIVESLDTFRRTLAKAISIEDIWPLLLVIAAALFLFDVFVRRVTVHFYWISPLVMKTWRRLRGQAIEAAADERMERLRGRKAVVNQQMEDRRASSRFEPSPDATAEGRDLDTVLGDASLSSDRPVSQPGEKKPTAAAESQEADSYTERLLAAKKKAQRDGK